MAKFPENLEQFMHVIAEFIGATEAAAFAVEPDFFDGYRITTLTHVRPHEADDEVRGAAVAALKDILIPFVQHARDGAIEIEESANREGTQFCLVALARHAEKVVGAATFIVRCRDPQDAQIMLLRLQCAASIV